MQETQVGSSAETADMVAGDSESNNKENINPGDFSCADIVKKGPKGQGLSPLAMGGAGNEFTGCCVTEN